MCNGHTTSHICFTQFQWVVVECIVHICDIYVINALFVLCLQNLIRNFRVQRSCHLDITNFFDAKCCV